MGDRIKSFLAIGAVLAVSADAFPQERFGVQELGKPSVKLSISPADPTTKDQITFTVEAVDTSRTGLKRIVLLVNDREVQVCLTSPCAYFGGPYSEGPLKYGARVFDNTSNDPWTGFRTVNVKSPSTPVGMPERAIHLMPLAESPSTRWTDGTIDLPFPGQEDGIRGFVCTQDDALLEDDQVYPRVLLTRPKLMEADASIIGIFKLENLPRNAVFRTNVGFLKEEDRTDSADFKVFVSRDPSLVEVRRGFYDGRLDDLALDLSRYYGQDVEIVLEVRALETLTRHLAVWVDPRIEW
jgi:hypothetical protein